MSFRRRPVKPPTFTPIHKDELRNAIINRNDGTKGKINDWNVANITDMSFLFKDLHDFNDDIHDWDTSNVTNMEGMFENATSFNQLLDTWRNSRGTILWNVENVTNMKDMFKGATSFNRSLKNWDTSKVTDMKRMFQGASSFNQILSNWNTSKVTDMTEMFQNADSFYQSLRSWNVKNCDNFDRFIRSDFPVKYLPKFKDALISSIEESSSVSSPNIEIDQHITKLISKSNKPLDWTGYDIISDLYYIYLINKYGSHCAQLDINMRVNMIEMLYTEVTKLHEAAAKIVHCITSTHDEIIIIPILLKFAGLKDKDSCHANILLYRRSTNTLEHFEPHGSFYLGKKHNLHLFLESSLASLVNFINRDLGPEHPPVRLETSDIVCPIQYGLQAIEEQYIQNKFEQGRGYCLAWSMFFTELVLRNPEVSSKKLLHTILRKTKGKNQALYLRKIIRGYVNTMSQRFDSFYSPVFGETITLDSITKKVKSDYGTFLDKTNKILSVFSKMTSGNVDGLTPEEDKIRVDLQTAIEHMNSENEMESEVQDKFNIVANQQIFKRINHFINFGMNINLSYSIIYELMLKIYFITKVRMYRYECIEYVVHLRSITKKTMEYARDIARCIKHKKDIFVVPINDHFNHHLDDKISNINFLIYRKKDRTFEYFEFYKTNNDTEINRLIEHINTYLTEYYSEPVRLKIVDLSCPPIIRDENLCKSWGLMIISLMLDYPYLSSDELLGIINNLMAGKNKEKFMKVMVTGFIRTICEDVKIYYSNILSYTELDDVQFLKALLDILTDLLAGNELHALKEKYKDTDDGIYIKIIDAIDIKHIYHEYNVESPNSDYIKDISDEPIVEEPIVEDIIVEEPIVEDIIVKGPIKRKRSTSSNNQDIKQRRIDYDDDIKTSVSVSRSRSRSKSKSKSRRQSKKNKGISSRGKSRKSRKNRLRINNSKRKTNKIFLHR